MSYNMRRETYSLTVSPGAGVTTVGTPAATTTTGIIFNGLLSQVFFTAPASVDASATMTVSVVDQDGNSVWSKGSIAANSGTTSVLLTPNATAGTNQAVPLAGYYQVLVTFSAAQTATASTSKVVLLINQG